MLKIAENIQAYDYDVKLLPGVTFPVRSTLVEIGNMLIIISPGPFPATEIKSIVEKYDAVFCVAPNAFHHLHIEGFNQRFPDIPLYGPTRVEKKQPALAGKIKRIDELSEIIKGQLRFIPINGAPELDETVFYCSFSKSLIVTDLVFNMRNPMPLGRKCILSLVGANNKIAQSKLVKKAIKNKPAYMQSIKLIRELELARIVPAHGDIIEGQADIKAALEIMSAV